jgi:septum formation protein
MTGDSPRIVLASNSPRRHDLLASLGVAFDVRAAHIDETPWPGEAAIDYVSRLAVEKCRAVEAEDDVLVIAADTTVDVDGVIFGKPESEDDARRMLRALSGRDHDVHTGVAMRIGSALRSTTVTTTVTMTAFDDRAIDWYLSTGEPFDKAGAYAMQGAAAVLVAGINGSVSNVVGLPMPTVRSLALDLGVDVFER